MAKPYSDDLRERVVADIEASFTREEVAELYNLALSTVGRFIKRKRETGSVSPAKFGGHKTFALAPHTALVRVLVAEQPDSTLAELKARLAKEKVKVSQSAIFRFLRHLSCLLKKERARCRARSFSSGSSAAVGKGVVQVAQVGQTAAASERIGCAAFCTT
jgi:transposase